MDDTPQAAGRELEVKLLIEPATMASMRRSPALRGNRAKTRRLHSVYFDTPDQRLRRGGIALRVRRQGNRYQQTVKLKCETKPGMFARHEIEAFIAGPQPSLTEITDPEVRERVVAQLAGAAIEASFSTEFQRSERRVQHGASQVLVCFDTGQITTANGDENICEIELELLSGPVGALYALATTLTQLGPVQLGVESKFDRGLRLLDGRTPAPVRAKPLSLSADASVEQAIEVIVGNCTEQILANEPAVRLGTDPEGVHQMRVGIRRLRSALSLFKQVLPGPQTVDMLAELRWIAHQLGVARELDVYIEETLNTDVCSAEPALAELRNAAIELREHAYQELRRDLSSTRFTQLILNLGAWLEAREWRHQPLTPITATLFQPAREALQTSLQTRSEKVRKRAQRIRTASVAQQHRLRLEIKKLRYACDAVAELYDSKKTARYCQRLVALQNILGKLNDISAAERTSHLILQHMDSLAMPQQHQAVGFLRGWLAADYRRMRGPLLKRCAKFAATKRFWEE